MKFCELYEILIYTLVYKKGSNSLGVSRLHPSSQNIPCCVMCALENTSGKNPNGPKKVHVEFSDFPEEVFINSCLFS